MVALVTTSCEDAKQKLGSLLGEGGADTEEASVDVEGLPTTTAFHSITPQDFQGLKARADQLTVVEFYSDT